VARPPPPRSHNPCSTDAGRRSSPLGAKFLDADGNIPREVMSDALHPSSKGYEIWAEAVVQPLSKLMGEGAEKCGLRLEAWGRGYWSPRSWSEHNGQEHVQEVGERCQEGRCHAGRCGG